jgi:hypothetical protein
VYRQQFVPRVKGGGRVSTTHPLEATANFALEQTMEAPRERIAIGLLFILPQH